MRRWLIVLFVTVSIVATGVVACALASRPSASVAAEQAWRQAGIENYRLDIAIDGCMACGPGPTRSSVVFANGEKTSTNPGYAPTVEDLYVEIEAYGPDGSMVTYNDVGVPRDGLR